MIYDHLSKQALYRNCHPGLDLAFDYLQRFSPATPDGKYCIDGERVFALVQSYATLPSTEKQFESHRNYIDLQYVVSGEELIYWNPLAALKAIDSYILEKDCQFYAGANEQAAVMRAGSFAIFFPHDGHKPGCSYRENAAMKKIVLKIKA